MQILLQPPRLGTNSCRVSYPFGQFPVSHRPPGLLRSLTLGSLRTWAWSLVIGVIQLVNIAMGAGPPTQQVLKIMPSGEWMLYGQIKACVYQSINYTYTVKVPVTVQKQVVIDGVAQTRVETQSQDETRTATKMVCKEFWKIACRPPLDVKKLKAFETDGKPIATADVAQRCQGATLVVVSANDEMIPDYYAALFKPGTIILALPTEPARDFQTPMIPTPPKSGGPFGTPVPVTPQPSPVPPGTSASRGRLPFRPVSQPHPLVPPSEGESRLADNFQPVFPSSPPPELVFVSREGADAIKIRQFEETEKWVELTMRVNDSSISPTSKQKVRQIMRQSTTTSVPWTVLRISQVQSSGDLPPDRLKEKLGQGETTAVMSHDGALVDSFWLQNFKPNVLVLRGIELPPRAPSTFGPEVISPQPPVHSPAPPLDEGLPSPTPSSAPKPAQPTEAR